MFKEKIKNIFGIQKESDGFPYHKNKQSNFEKFQCIEGSSIEIEYLELIRSLIFATKPHQVLETDPNFIEKTRQNLIKFDPSLLVNLINSNSLDSIPNINKKFSFVLLDSGSNSAHLQLRIKEFKLLLNLDMLLEDCIIFIHDTSRFDERFTGFRKEINKFTKNFQKIEIDSSRGCTIIKYNKKILYT
jgi:hypothetical protein